MGTGPRSIGTILLSTVMLVIMPASTDKTWQPKIGGEPGERVEGDAELEQSLNILMATPVESVPGKPEYGVRIPEYVDLPIDVARPLVVKEVLRAVAANLPRLVLVGVNVTSPALGHIESEITWKPAAGGSNRVTTVRTSA
jgi:phage baseplate assembly protein W